MAAAGLTDPTATASLLKSEGQIKEDMAVLHGTLTKTTAGKTKEQVTEEYTNYMNGKNAAGTASQEVRLYTKWNGTDVTDDTSKNKYVEFRIIQVGEHDSDGSAITFMATHALPTAAQMNSSATNKNGWTASSMYKTLNQSGGYVMAGLSDLVNSGSVKAVTKKSPTGSYGSWTTTSTSTDTFWLLAYSEVVAGGDTNYADEGTRYTWFANGGDYKSNLYLTRAASRPTDNAYNDWYLRSPYLSFTNAFGFIRATSGIMYTAGPTIQRSVVPCFAF